MVAKRRGRQLLSQLSHRRRHDDDDDDDNDTLPTLASTYPDRQIEGGLSLWRARSFAGIFVCVCVCLCRVRPFMAASAVHKPPARIHPLAPLSLLVSAIIVVIIVVERRPLVLLFLLAAHLARRIRHSVLLVAQYTSIDYHWNYFSNAHSHQPWRQPSTTPLLRAQLI